LLTESQTLRTKLGYLRSRGHDVAVFRVLDPAETAFSFAAPALFHDVESGRKMYVDPEVARAGYLQRFQSHAAELEKVCRDAGADFVVCPTDRPLELGLFDLLRARLRRGRHWRRRPGAARRRADGRAVE
jgi:uncharacterized protein (DUF58 family)